MFSTGSNTDMSLKNILQSYYRKRFISFRHFLSMCRLKNSKKLILWAMVEGLSQIARGQPNAANIASVMARYSLTYKCIFTKLNNFASMLRESNRQLLQAQCSLDAGFDNFQVFMSRNFQRNGASVDSMHATCRLTKRLFPILPTVGSILFNELNDYMHRY